MSPTKAPSSKGEFDPGLLLNVLTAIKKGDFSARLPLDWTGIPGKIADTLNDIVEINDKGISNYKNTFYNVFILHKRRCCL